MLSSKLEGSNNAEAANSKGLRRLYLWWFRSFYLCNHVLQMLSLSFVESCLFLCCGVLNSGIKVMDAHRLNKLIREAGSVVGSQLVFLEEVLELRMLGKPQEIIENTTHPPFFPFWRYIHTYI